MHNKHLRPRNYVLVGGSILVLLYKFLSDPDGGAMTTVFLGELATPILAVWFAYLARWALFDYLDMQTFAEESKKSPVGAGLVFLGICVLMYGLLGLFGNTARAQDTRTYIPEKAHVYLPAVKAEQQVLWVDHPKPITSLV